jgi:GTP-binding protein EngB required for normal cell division
LSHPSQESYVLFLAWSNKSDELWKENIQLFMSLLKTYGSEKEKYKFVIVDCDIKPEYSSKGTAIVHYVNGQCRSEDVLKMNKADASLCLAQSNNKEDCTYLPNNRTPIKLRCPGSLNGGICDNSTHQWLCHKCRQPLEYGFDDYFYCSCGKSKTTAFQYRCNSEKHGSAFISYPEQSLNNYLTMIRPLQETNILILGETGVGKSTWLNGFANYVMYTSLAEAEKGELINLIPSSFTMTDDDYNERVIKTGEDSNENLTAGQSSTQYPVAYTLSYGDKIIRLIDTPGIGDTRGTIQDEKNIENILQFISNHQEIHGICILLKPNSARLTLTFRFCIKELLTHLHRSASQNIVFCFTNCRSTFYRPGDTLPALRTLLAENPDVEISLAKHTIYCMDNESFRFLAALQNGISFGEKDRQDYAVSWERSVEETTRLLQHIQTLKPHKVKDTLTLNGARRIVIGLSKPIATISQNIQTNIALLKDKELEIKSFKGSIEDLQTKMYIPYSYIEAIPLDYPRTVCTSDRCVEVILDENGLRKIHYKTHCHKRCRLNGVATDVTNNVALQNCSAMDANNNCTNCGCPWYTHMHITYETSTVVTKKIDPNIEQQINTKEEGKRQQEKFIQDLNQEIIKLKNEQEIINKASAKFACFLKQNAISAYNDAIADYLDVLIREEKNKINAGGDDKTLLGLEQMKRDYTEQVKILDDAIKQGGDQITITPDDIKELEQKLLNLEINGKDLREIMKVSTAAKSNAVAYNERRLQTRNSQRSDGLISDFTNAVTGVANKMTDAANALQNFIFGQ